jgi:hypothetical protein
MVTPAVTPCLLLPLLYGLLVTPWLLLPFTQYEKYRVPPCPGDMVMKKNSRNGIFFFLVLDSDINSQKCKGRDEICFKIYLGANMMFLFTYSKTIHFS